MYKPIVFRDNDPGHCGVGAHVSSVVVILSGRGKEYPTRLDLVSIDATLDNRDGRPNSMPAMWSGGLTIPQRVFMSCTVTPLGKWSWLWIRYSLSALSPDHPHFVSDDWYLHVYTMRLSHLCVVASSSRPIGDGTWRG